MSWEPVLDGHLAEAASAAVREIADHLEDVEPARRSPVDTALFWAYAAGALEDEASLARYDAAVARLAEHVERGFVSMSLYGGLAGAGWVLAHISEDASEFLDGVDQTLLGELERGPWRGNYDLVGGLVGQGVYFLERLRGTGGATARRGIAQVVDQLAATAEPAAGGMTWHTAPELLIGWQRKRWPAGYYNLGMAHGVPGVIAMLGAVAALPEPELAQAAARARELCAGAIRWLRAQRLTPDPRGCFPGIIGREDLEPRDGRDPRVPGLARTAWCYGEPGIAAGLWSAATRLGGDPAEARELALEAARRPVGLCQVTDPNLCHGAAGLAHLWNRFYQASGEPGFRDAARGWFERALAMRRPGKGIAGFMAWRPRAPGVDDTLIEQSAPELLDGVLGVGLALLAGLGGDEPGWDRLLLCDLPQLAS